ncbi:3505_t:CDS:10, partial [Scutellospora calospora]
SIGAGTKAGNITRLVKEKSKARVSLEELTSECTAKPIIDGNSSDIYAELGLLNLSDIEYRAEVLLDKVLVSGDLNYVRLARQVALKRAYVVRVADEDSWDIASKMAIGDILNPISELLGSKQKTAGSSFARVFSPGCTSSAPCTATGCLAAISGATWAAKSVRRIHGALFTNFLTKLTIRAAVAALEFRNWCVVTSTASEERSIMPMSVALENILVYPFEEIELDQKTLDNTQRILEEKERYIECCKTISIGVGVAEGRNSFVLKELDSTNGQTGSEALLIHARRRKLAGEGVGAFGDIGSNLGGVGSFKDILILQGDVERNMDYIVHRQQSRLKNSSKGRPSRVAKGYYETNLGVGAIRAKSSRFLNKGSQYRGLGAEFRSSRPVGVSLERIRSRQICKSLEFEEIEIQQPVFLPRIRGCRLFHLELGWSEELYVLPFQLNSQSTVLYEGMWSMDSNNSSIAPESSAAGLVQKLLERAEYLMDTGFVPYPASRKLLAAFLVWLEVSGRISEMPTCLAAVAREHKLRNLMDLMKGSSIHLIVEGIKRVVAPRKAEAKWPRDPLLVGVVRQYMEYLSLRKGMDQDFKVQDRSTREGKVSSDRKNTKKPLFLSRMGGKLLVAAVTAIVKYFAGNAGLQRRYTAHSLRIGGAIAAMKGGMTMEQIQSIGGWTSGAVQLYTRAISMAEIGASRLMGFN